MEPKPVVPKSVVPPGPVVGDVLGPEVDAESDSPVVASGWQVASQRACPMSTQDSPQSKPQQDASMSQRQV